MPDKTNLSRFLIVIFFLSAILASCNIVKKAPQNKPFIFRNTIDINGGKFNNEERNSLRQRLFTQLDDSAKVTVKDVLFFIHFIKRPTAFDTGYVGVSARNIRGSMLHLGYYNTQVTYKADTVKVNNKQRVFVKYMVEAGKPTVIDTISYRFKKPALQYLADSTKNRSFLVKGKPITKADVLGETTRLVELYRNNGYYKFTSDDLRLRGDTTIAALTTISDDPFANLELLQEAAIKQKENPTIKLNMILNPLGDSTRLKKFYINNIYVYPDFTEADAINPISTGLDEHTTRDSNYIIRIHQKLVRTGVIIRNMSLRKGDVYSQENYAKTLSSFSRTGVWQTLNIQVKEVKDSTSSETDTVGKVDIFVQLIPAKKYGFETNLEASYSANNNTNSISSAGNLLGLSTNVSLQNRNVAKSAIKMTHALRAGIELSLTPQNGSNKKLNSTELSYSNTISFPRLLGPIKLITKDKKPVAQQTFINVTPAYVNRINLFSQLSASVAFGNEWSFRPNRKNIFKLPNIEYSYLYNQSDSFKRTLDANPYLRYSFNTALVIGTSYGYQSTYINPSHPERQRTFKWNIEESGLLLGRLNVFKKQLRQFIKTDLEYTYIVAHNHTATVFRAFGGIGIPIGKSDTTLPFFKQYFGGGPNSMRGWPVRGIGPGGKSLAPYNSVALNDRTGDIRFEVNGEFRYNILQIIPNSLALRGALFTDIGNVWNLRRTIFNAEDTLQFQFKNFYKQLGVTVGTGFRFDFNYFLLRFDLGFRVKRPDITENNGWKIPNITFNNLFKKGETIPDPDHPGSFINDYRYRIWRYENFNFTIGLSYPF